MVPSGTGEWDGSTSRHRIAREHGRSYHQSPVRYAKLDSGQYDLHLRVPTEVGQCPDPCPLGHLPLHPLRSEEGSVKIGACPPGRTGSPVGYGAKALVRVDYRGWRG